MTTFRLLAAAALALAAGAPAFAQVSVSEPWVRGVVPQQKATGMFATVTSAGAGRLVAARSPVAGVVEIHEMTMDGTTMRMRALPNGIELPAGKAVELKPGGLHVMLMDLNQPLKAGDTVDVTFVVETGGQRQEIAVKAPVRPLGNAKADGHGPHGHHGHKH